MHLQGLRTPSMSPVSDADFTLERFRQSSPTGATTAGWEVALSSDHAKVPDQPFRLMDLPLELRSMIFRHFLVMPGPVLFTYFAAPHARHDSAGVESQNNPLSEDFTGLFPEHNGIQQSSLLNIFSASKTVYRETVPLYFGCNQFEFCSLDRMEQFLNKIGAECRWQIASITVEYWGRAPARAVKRLAECVGLRVLMLKIGLYSFGRSHSSPAQKARLIGMKDLLRLRGLDRISIASNGEFKYKCFADAVVPTQDVIDMFMEQLEVVTEARDPKQLKRQEKKDFPTKTKRTTFGAANVMTRSETRMQHTQH